MACKFRDKLAWAGGRAALTRAHSKTCRRIACAPRTRSVLKCGSLLPLSDSGGKPPHSKRAAHAKGADNWPAGHIPATPSIRLILPWSPRTLASLSAFETVDGENLSSRNSICREEVTARRSLALPRWD